MASYGQDSYFENFKNVSLYDKQRIHKLKYVRHLVFQMFANSMSMIVVLEIQHKRKLHNLKLLWTLYRIIFFEMKNMETQDWGSNPFLRYFIIQKYKGQGYFLGTHTIYHLAQVDIRKQENLVLVVGISIVCVTLNFHIIEFVDIKYTSIRLRNRYFNFIKYCNNGSQCGSPISDRRFLPTIF